MQSDAGPPAAVIWQAKSALAKPIIRDDPRSRELRFVPETG